MHRTSTIPILPLLVLLAACGEEPPARAPQDTPAAPRAVSTVDRPAAAEAAATDSVAVVRTSLVIVAYGENGAPSPVQLAVVDPRDRTTGVVAAGGRAYTGIPGSDYSVATVAGDPSGATAPVVRVETPERGEWEARIVSSEGGRYVLDVQAVHADGSARRASIPPDDVASGEMRAWRIVYDPADASRFLVERAAP